MAEDEPSVRPLAKGNAPMWKTFMVTDLDKIERVSGQLHSKAQPREESETGLLPEKEKMTRQAKVPEQALNSDVYHEPEPEPMPKPEITITRSPKELGLEGREIFLKPLLPFGVEEKPRRQTLPSRSEDLLFGFRNPGSQLGKTGMFVPRMKGLKEPKEREG